MNLILLDQKDQTAEREFNLSDHRAEHIRDILGGTLGDRLQVGLVNGPSGTAEIIRIDSRTVKLSVELNQPMPLPPIEIDLVCALPRPQTVKKILRLCGMMAIRRLYLIRANRVEKSFYDSPLLTDHKMRPLLLEGLAQGKFTRLTDISIEHRFRPFIEDKLAAIYQDSSDPVRLLPEQSAAENILTVLAGIKNFPKEILMAVGPEGGWVDFELDLLAANHFKKFSLGPWTLRVEDAVTASLAQIELARTTLASNSGE